MLIEQDTPNFKPVTITLETVDEFDTFRLLIQKAYDGPGSKISSERVRQMADNIASEMSLLDV